MPFSRLATFSPLGLQRLRLLMKHAPHCEVTPVSGACWKMHIILEQPLSLSAQTAGPAGGAFRVLA